jgi:hypothetical protein
MNFWQVAEKHPRYHADPSADGEASQPLLTCHKPFFSNLPGIQ